MLYGLTGLIGGVPSMAGGPRAIRRSALSEIGGFPGFRSSWARTESPAVLTIRGYRIAVSPLPARCTDGGRDAKAVISRVARWLTVVRAQRPLLLLTYPLLMAATPAVLLWAALWQTSTLSILAMALLISRMLLNRFLRHLQRERSSLLGTPFEVLAAELLCGWGWRARWERGSCAGEAICFASGRVAACSRSRRLYLHSASSSELSRRQAVLRQKQWPHLPRSQISASIRPARQAHHRRVAAALHLPKVPLPEAGSVTVAHQAIRN